MEKTEVSVKTTGTPDDSDAVKAPKKKRYSSRQARRFGEIETRVSKSLHRVSKAVDNGVSTYLEKRDKSARKRRDGAVVDFYENAAVGISQALSESSPVLSDFAEMVNSRRSRKAIRRAVRAIPLL
jgi:ribosomal protein L14